jgi:hypothetical protein
LIIPINNEINDQKTEQESNGQCAMKQKHKEANITNNIIKISKLARVDNLIA